MAGVGGAADNLKGGAGNDSLNGGGDKDTMNGGDGLDTCGTTGGGAATINCESLF